MYPTRTVRVVSVHFGFSCVYFVISILYRHLYAQILIKLFPDEYVSSGIETYLIHRIIKWEIDWDSLDITYVLLLIQMIRNHFATQLIQINDGNIAIANHAIVQKMVMNVCVGIIIISKTAWVANFNFQEWNCYV